MPFARKARVFAFSTTSPSRFTGCGRKMNRGRTLSSTWTFIKATALPTFSKTMRACWRFPCMAPIIFRFENNAAASTSNCRIAPATRSIFRRSMTRSLGCGIFRRGWFFISPAWMRSPAINSAVWRWHRKD